MLWFKHLSNSRNDKNIQAIVDRWGLEGVTRYFWIIEIITEQMRRGGPPELSISPAYWVRELRFRSAINARSFLDWLAFERRMIDVTYSNDWCVRVEKINEIKAREMVIERKNASLEIDKETEKEIEPPKPPADAGPVTVIFNAYRNSWKKTEAYKLTDSRRRAIKQVLADYGQEVALQAIKLFRSDQKHPDRAAYSDLEYLFGRPKNRDHWCQRAQKILANRSQCEVVDLFTGDHSATNHA